MPDLACLRQCILNGLGNNRWKIEMALRIDNIGFLNALEKM